MIIGLSTFFFIWLPLFVCILALYIRFRILHYSGFAFECSVHSLFLLSDLDLSETSGRGLWEIDKLIAVCFQ